MTVTDGPVLLSDDRDGVRTLTLNRPHRKNAITHELWIALRDALVAAPDDARDLDEWAAVANMSRRTFTRTFRDETGLSFSDWRQQARIFEALALLATGKSVTTTALEVGYGSVSAFTAMFRRSFGVAPTAYLNERMD